MLSDGDGLLDQVVQVFGDGGVQTYRRMFQQCSDRGGCELTVGLQDSENLVTGDELDLGNTVGVSQDDTDLGGAQTSSGKLEDLVTDFLGGGLGPRRLRPSVRKGGGSLSCRSRRGASRGRADDEAICRGRREGREHKVGCQFAMKHY